jgi:glutamine amidotransferase
MITLIDYGVGNLKAFLNLYERLHIPVKIATTSDEIKQATKLILPGVGHFDHAMQLFNRSGMKDAVIERVTVDCVPILGICVGMQMLASSSDEGVETGLNWIPGSVKSLRGMLTSNLLPAPHMGWNDVKPSRGHALFNMFAADECRFYFLHSYYFIPDDAAHNIGSCEYSFEFCCAVNKGNIYGVQFHPEKSHKFGELILKNFAEL